MTAAADILNSDRRSVLVLEVWLDNSELNPVGFYEWVGGDSMLAHSIGDGPYLDNSYYVLSNDRVSDLATNEVLVGDLYFEKNLSNEFGGGADWSIGSIEVEFTADSRNFHLRDWENKAFTLSIGYYADNFADYETLATGKTIGCEIVGRKMSVQLSINPIGTDRLYPVETYHSGDSKGRAKPFIFGTVNKIAPVPIDENLGLWQFHNGAIDWTNANSCEDVPANHLDPAENQGFGATSYRINAAGNNVTNAVYTGFPGDLSEGSADVSTNTDQGFIEVIPPVYADTGTPLFLPDYARVTVSGGLGFSFAGDGWGYTFSATIGLSDSSTNDSFVVSFNGEDITVTKDARQFNYRGYLVITGNWSFEIDAIRASDGTEDSDTIEILIYDVRVIFNRQSSPDCQAFTDDGVKVSTFRVDDCNAILGALPSWVFVYDANGYCRGKPGVTHVIDCVGGDSDIKSVAACQAISTAANGTASPVTASFTGEQIGVYITEQKAMITHIREILRPLDCFIEPEIATNNLTVRRRYNHQPTDFNGAANVLTAFSFEQHEIDETKIKKFASDKPYSRYTVLYKYNHYEPDQSPTEGAFNPRGHLSQRKQIITGVRTSADAAQIASLISRDGNRRPRYGVEITGVGYELNLSDVGAITHDYIHSGLFEVRKIRENIVSRRTYLEGVVYV